MNNTILADRNPSMFTEFANNKNTQHVDSYNNYVSEKEVSHSRWICEKLDEATKEANCPSTKRYSPKEVWAYLKEKYPNAF